MTIVATRELTPANAPAAYRGGTTNPLDAGDSDTWNTPVDTEGDDASVQPIRSNPELIASARFSVAGATAEIACGLWHKNGSTWTFLGLAGVLTANGDSSQQDGDSRYPSTEMLRFAMDCATHYELRCKSISSGNVVLNPLLLGPSPQGPESLS